MPLLRHRPGLHNTGPATIRPRRRTRTTEYALDVSRDRGPSYQRCVCVHKHPLTDSGSAYSARRVNTQAALSHPRKQKHLQCCNSARPSLAQSTPNASHTCQVATRRLDADENHSSAVPVPPVLSSRDSGFLLVDVPRTWVKCAQYTKIDAKSRLVIFPSAK